MKIKCVKEIPTEYITVGQEYDVTIEAGVVDYCRVGTKIGSYMTASSLARGIQTGAIVVLEEIS